MSWLAGKRILITGGAGFVGSPVARRLQKLECHLFIPRSRQYDLTRWSDVVHVYDEFRPQVVIHMAANVGGIGYHLERPGELFYDNAIMGLQVIELARQRGVEKLVAIGSVCAYPKSPPVPFREEDLWTGYPEETNAPYGVAKRMLLVQAQAYRQQYGFNAIYLLPANIYGPGDNFDLTSSHVIPALIRKCIEARDAGKEYIEVWGTGTSSREFLYVDDAAAAIVLATERYNRPEAVNVGTGRETSIKELAESIARLTEFDGQIRWDRFKPDGQPRRFLDISRTEESFGFRAETSLDEGLRRTIAWYQQARAGLPS